MRSNSAAEFARVFRAQAYSGIEYSYDSARDRTGITVGGGPDFIPYVERFAAGLPFAVDWAWAVRNFTKFLVPDTFLLRMDCRAEEILAVTLYCRYPSEPSDTEFERAMTRLRPMRWTGPAPSRIATILGLAGPRGIGLRVDKQCNYKTALYYKLETRTAEMPPATLPDLARECGLPEEVSAAVGADIRALYPPGPVGVIGIDSADSGSANTLKFNPANVPLRAAFAYVKGKGATEARIAELANFAGSFRALWASYLGSKYNLSGFAGWRMYFSIQPASVSSASSTRLAAEKSLKPTLRLPHY